MQSITGVRFNRTEPPVFCDASDVVPELFDKVRVVTATGETREGIVAVPPSKILAAPIMDALPRLTEILSARNVPETVPDGLIVCSVDNAVSPADVLDACALSRIPVPEAVDVRKEQR